MGIHYIHMSDTLYKRDIIDQIIPFLGTNNIIVLHGARQVGKTHILYLLQNHLKAQHLSTHYIDLEDSRYVDILNLGTDSFLSYLKSAGLVLTGESKHYIFIDEIQHLDHPSPLLKLLIDHHPYLQLIVSGSSSFDIKSKFSDSLVGRTVSFEIFPLSFSEFLRFKQTSPITSLDASYREYMSYGGYPKIVLTDELTLKEKYLQQIIDTYVKKDIFDLAKVTEPIKFNNLIKVLASSSGQLLNITQLGNICDLSSATIRHYLHILESTYVIKLVVPFSRSVKVEVSRTPKIFFYDTGLLQMLLLKKLQSENIGNTFETSVFSELVKKYGVSQINYWRNKNGNEIDFILQTQSGILPIEVKYNFNLFSPNKIALFLQKYHLTNYQVIGLHGTKSSPHYFYPWEV